MFTLLCLYLIYKLHLDTKCLREEIILLGGSYRELESFRKDVAKANEDMIKLSKEALKTEEKK